MKTYIAKDELLNKANIDIDIEAWIISIEEMDELPIVTEADICREFIQRLLSKAVFFAENDHMEISIREIRNVLAEMESE